MKPLHVKEFKGIETVKLNDDIKTNGLFFSKIKNFQGKLSQSHFSIKLPIYGLENYKVNGRNYRLDSQSYLVTNACQDIEAVVKSRESVIGVCIGFNKAFIYDLAGSVGQKLEEGIDNPFDTMSAINFTTKKTKLKEDQLSLILNTIKRDIIDDRLSENYEEEQFYISLGELLLEHQAKILSDINRLPNVKFSTREEIYKRVSLMDDYILENYKREIKLDQLSQISFLSKFHAIRCYQKIYQISPYQKILRLRLKDAAYLIQLGMPIKDVADELNFADYRALTKQFKKYYKVTPTQFKIKNIKDS